VRKNPDPPPAPRAAPGSTCPFRNDTGDAGHACPKRQAVRARLSARTFLRPFGGPTGRSPAGPDGWRRLIPIGAVCGSPVTHVLPSSTNNPPQFSLWGRSRAPDVGESFTSPSESQNETCSSRAVRCSSRARVYSGGFGDFGWLVSNPSRVKALCETWGTGRKQPTATHQTHRSGAGTREHPSHNAAVRQAATLEPVAIHDPTLMGEQPLAKPFRVDDATLAGDAGQRVEQVRHLHL
jgi:hypothetical protein